MANSGRVYPARRALEALVARENGRHNAPNIVVTFADGERVRPFRFVDIDYDVGDRDPAAEEERRRRNEVARFRAAAWLWFWWQTREAEDAEANARIDAELAVAPSCPACGASSVALWCYGEPRSGVEERAFAKGDVKIGGCIFWEESPRWHCRACRHSWGRFLERE